MDLNLLGSALEIERHLLTGLWAEIADDITILRKVGRMLRCRAAVEIVGRSTGDEAHVGDAAGNQRLVGQGADAYRAVDILCNVIDCAVGNA
ncbi:hypothetical protein D3C78_1823540 [compost metagenome]